MNTGVAVVNVASRRSLFPVVPSPNRRSVCIFLVSCIVMPSFGLCAEGKAKAPGKQAKVADRMVTCDLPALCSLFDDGRWVRIEHAFDAQGLVLATWVGRRDELLVLRRHGEEWKAMTLCGKGLAEPKWMAATVIGVTPEVLVGVEHESDGIDVQVVASTDGGILWSARTSLRKPERYIECGWLLSHASGVVTFTMCTTEGRSHFSSPDVGRSWTPVSSHVLSDVPPILPLLIEATTEELLLDYLDCLAGMSRAAHEKKAGGTR